MGDRPPNLGRLANAEATQLGCNSIAPEHLLLAVVGTGGATARVLATRGICVGVLRAAVRRVSHPAANEAPPSSLPFGPEAKQAFELAIEAARQFDHNAITQEHILLGLLADNAGPAVAALAGLGVDSEWLRRAVLAVAGWSD